MNDLAHLTLPQLKQLQNRIAKELSKRESDTKYALLKRLRKLARDEGLELDELLGTKAADETPQAKEPKRRVKAASSSAEKKPPVPAKYRNPNNLDQSWSGRGRRPAWFEAWVNNGGSVAALENAAMLAKGRKMSSASSPDESEPTRGIVALTDSPTQTSDGTAPND